jgi:hypothetical protein
MSSQTLKKGEKLPHYCALFATFDPVPAAADRAELYFERYCQERLAQATTGGPSPGKYCPGGKVIL